MELQSLPFRERLRICYPTLTKGQKRVGEYMLKHVEEVAVETAQTIGKRAGTSETTVIRFCYALGYKGFGEIQKEQQRVLLSSNNRLSTYVETNQKIAKDELFYSRILARDASNIESIMDKLETHLLDQVIEDLSTAPRVLVVGLGSSYGAAFWFGFTLNIMRGNTTIYRSDPRDFSMLPMDLNSDWLVVVFSFERYSKESIMVAKTAKACGAKVVTITDSLLSPVSSQADLVIPLSLHGTTTLDMMPPLVSLLNGLLAKFSVENSEAVKFRVEQYYAAAQTVDTFAEINEPNTN